jgi:hypothetical protein
VRRRAEQAQARTVESRVEELEASREKADRLYMLARSARLHGWKIATMSDRAATLLTTIVTATAVLSTIGAKSTTQHIWNASESAPVGLYRLHPIRKFVVTELVAIQRP